MTNARRLEFVRELQARITETLLTAQREEPGCPAIAAALAFNRQADNAAARAILHDQARAQLKAAQRAHAEANPCEGGCVHAPEVEA